MKKKIYKKSKAVYNAIHDMFHELNDCTDLGYIAMERTFGDNSLPPEIKALVARGMEVLDKISGKLTEEDFEMLADVEEFLEDNIPESIARKLLE